MNFKAIAQIVALALYLGAWWVKKAFGWDVQPSVLVAVGGLLTTLVMHSQPVGGKWAPIFTKALGVAFAAVAIAFTVAPVETAGVLKLSDQIAATEVIVNPTPAEPDASNAPTPSVAPDVVGSTTEAAIDSGTLYVAPDASTPDVINDVTNDTNESHDAGKTPDAAGQ